MTTRLPVPYNRTNDELHPVVYRSIIGLTIWLVLSVWALFSRGAYEGVTLSVITLFFLILVGIPVILWLSWRRNTDPNERHGCNANFATDRRGRLRHDDLRVGVSVYSDASKRLATLCKRAPHRRSSISAGKETNVAMDPLRKDPSSPAPSRLAVNGIPVSDHGPSCARNDF